MFEWTCDNELYDKVRNYSSRLHKVSSELKGKTYTDEQISFAIEGLELTIEQYNLTKELHIYEKLVLENKTKCKSFVEFKVYLEGDRFNKLIIYRNEKPLDSKTQKSKYYIKLDKESDEFFNRVTILFHTLFKTFKDYPVYKSWYESRLLKVYKTMETKIPDTDIYQDGNKLFLLMCILYMPNDIEY